MKKSVSFGICSLCNERISKLAMARHLASCSPSHDSRSGKAGVLFHLRVEGKELADFWLDLEIKGDASLWDLDDLLRRVWLECCGHMSAFKINSLNYVYAVDGEFGSNLDERDMNVQISNVLTSGQRFTYEYDFGSTTQLMLRVLGMRKGIITDKAETRLLARNEPQVWVCATCGGPATVVCAFCIYDGNPFSCEEHVPEHACGEDEGFLPVVNSPRMGVCGYSG